MRKLMPAAAALAPAAMAPAHGPPPLSAAPAPWDADHRRRDDRAGQAEAVEQVRRASLPGTRA